MTSKKIVIVGSGVAGYNAATKLVKEGYNPKLITMIDAGKDPYKRQPDEVMRGSHGAGLFSDGKWSYLHNAVGGQLAKYMGEEKADQVLDEAWRYILEFHPDPSKIMFSEPLEEPEFIKPYFNLRMAPAYHIGTNYLHDMGKKWYDWLVEKGVNFYWECEVQDIDFDEQVIKTKFLNGEVVEGFGSQYDFEFDKLVYGTGKSGIDLTQKLIDKYGLFKESKSVQLGVRMELPQKYMQSIVDIAYDFKLYKRHNDKVSSRSFCLPPGEKIFIQRNNTFIYENIENITTSDKVLTYNIENNKTEFINPIGTTSRYYKGDIINFNEGELKTTEDHILFTVEKNKTKKEGIVKKGKSQGKKWWNYSNSLSKIEEKPAKDINLKDRLLRPHNFEDYLNKEHKNDNVLPLEFYYILGLWMADGSANYNKSKENRLGNSIQITNTPEVLEQVDEFLKSKWIKTNHIYHENYSILTFNSKFFVQYLQKENLFKKGLKRGLPQNIHNLSKPEIYSILSGMIDGDGRVKKEHNISIDYFTSSELMVRDLSYLLNLLNIKYTIQKKRNQTTNFSESSSPYVINICDRESIEFLKQNLKLKNPKKLEILNLDNEINNFEIKNYQKIFDINREYYEGHVYDLTIPDTHNFIAGRIPLVIHNCSNNFAAYVAEEVTYDMKSYNGHSYKQENMINNMTNFGIIMEIKGIDNPFQFQKDIVSKCQIDGKGIHYSPNFTRKPSLTAEGKEMNVVSVGDLNLFKEVYGEYADYIINYIEDLNKVFNFGDDYSLYIPEVKFLSEEVLTNYDDLSLINYPNIHFVGDSLSSRGIAVSAAQGVYCCVGLLK
jgi:uncharacterized FAD-dependent dehydrogenase/intein/homing endonuclease